MDGTENNNTNSSVYILHKPEKGRCLHVKKPYEKDEIIFVEEPIVCSQFSWNITYKYLACDHCMRPLEAVKENIERLSQVEISEIPFAEFDSTDKSQHTTCPFCEVMYCSPLCQEIAYLRYHRNVCFKRVIGDPLFELDEKWKEMHYPPETMSILLLTRIVATIEQSENPQETYNKFMQFCNQTSNEAEQLLHNMLEDKYEGIISVVSEYFTQAMKARKISTTKYDFIDQLLTKEGFMKMLGVVARNSQGIGTSALAVWAKTVLDLQLSEEQTTIRDVFLDKVYCMIETASGTFLNNEGSGLYELQSCINHSCEPNAEVVFPYNNSTLAIKTLRNIDANEEITINYLDECENSMSWRRRQEFIRKHYLFTCNCPRCETEAMAVDDEDDDSEEYSDGDEELLDDSRT